MNDKPRILTFLGNTELRLLVGALLASDYNVRHERPGSPPIEAVHTYDPQLLLVEMESPGISGLEIVCRIRKDPLYGQLVVVGMGPHEMGGSDKVALVAGCTGFIYYPLEVNTFRSHVRAFLNGDREELDLKEHLYYYRLFSEALIEKLEKRLETLERKTAALEGRKQSRNQLMFQVLTSMVTLIETKDPYLNGHSRHVTRYSLELAKRIGIHGEDLQTLERAALLHDIGKISIDLRQINKPGKLNKEEWAIVRQHPETGYKILSEIDFLQDEAQITKYHHYLYEEYGNHSEIPARIRKLASIITIADSFDAMTTQRPYNKPFTLEGAEKELSRCAGDQFDPELVSAFIDILGEDPPLYVPNAGKPNQRLPSCSQEKTQLP